MSPLVTLLRALQQTKLQTYRNPSLPVTLKTLILRDQEHNKIPSLFQLLANSITPCKALCHLTMECLVHINTVWHLHSLGLPVAHETIAVESWSQLTSEEQFDTYAYFSVDDSWSPVPAKKVRNIAKTLDWNLERQRRDWPGRSEIQFVRRSGNLPGVPSNAVVLSPCQGICHQGEFVPPLVSMISGEFT